MTTHKKDTVNNDLPLPRDKMPEAWFNDERMNSMYAEFRNRSVNPQDWNSKYKFWDEFIANYLSHKQQCSFTILDLKKIFKRKGRTPLCLPTVVEELYKKRELITEQELLSRESTGWLSWAVRSVVKAPVVWIYSELKNYFIPNVTNVDLKYIHVDTIKELSDLILSLAYDKAECLTVAQITKKCREESKNSNITEANVKLALLWLVKSRKASPSIMRHHDKWDCILKVSSDGITELSESEVNLLKLKDSEKRLLEKIEGLEVERNKLLEKAKSSIASGLREVAKTYVRNKKEVDKRIEKSSATLHNLQTLIANIHDAHSNTEVLQAYKRGSEMLKNFETAGLSEISVKDTMDEMHETLGELKEIKDVLAEPLNVSSYDSELEEELEELLKSDLTKDISLPEVPNDGLPTLEHTLKSLDLKDLPSRSLQSPNL